MTYNKKQMFPNQKHLETNKQTPDVGPAREVGR